MGEVAHSLYGRHGENFSSLALLFPSRRARLFFAEELAVLCDRPLWEPEWLSLDKLMEELADLHVGDRLRLITELYRVYSHHHQEEFDHFYYWGERLIADFDMVDKYRVDADMLFCNIADLKALEADLSYLSEEQRRIINHFWQGVLNKSADSKERQHFLRIWNSLGPIYHEYRKRLEELGFAYSGMVQRRAADRLQRGEASLSAGRQYVVAGFNALSECEKLLFDHLKNLGAEFYWDYDNYYVTSEEQEAGMFLRENRRRYPEPLGKISHDNMPKSKQIEVVSTASDAVQCKSVARLLDTFRNYDEKGNVLPLDRRTAIVLTDENLLVPLLYALTPRKKEGSTAVQGELFGFPSDGRSSKEPVALDRVNVTMGFPLKQSVAYTFVERLIELQAHGRRHRESYAFYHADVLGLMTHPYLEGKENSELAALCAEIVADRRVTISLEVLARNELLSSIFRPVVSWRDFSDYLLRILSLVGCENFAPSENEQDQQKQQRAFLMLLSEEITKLRNSLDQCDIELSISTYTSLLRRHLQSVRVPYSGEPLDGIQVMGILETRNLDFDQVILLSMTDDNFPGVLDSGASYIPYNLRAAYHLPTPEHHEGVFSYYFYRLIQRARRVVLCYCSHADDKTTGEPSRYIRQLAYESNFPISYSEVGVDVNLPDQKPIEVAKVGSVRERLERYLQRENPAKISPTAFARYLTCPLKFYFASIAHLEEKEEISDDVDNPLFGTILHASMQEIYQPLLNRLVQQKELAELMRSGEVERRVSDVINREILHDPQADDHDYSGNLLLVRDIVVRYIRQGILPYDAANDGFTIEGLECGVEANFCFDGERTVHLAGQADRIDRMNDGTLRVVDYKTGRVHLVFNGLDDLFLTKNRGENANLFQTLLYSLMLWIDRKEDALPALYYVREINRKEFSPYLVDKSLSEKRISYLTCREGFEHRMREKLSELFDYNTPFRPCEDVEQCTYCDFKTICRR